MKRERVAAEEGGGGGGSGGGTTSGATVGPKMAPLLSRFEVGSVVEDVERKREVLTRVDSLLMGFVECTGNALSRRTKAFVLGKGEAWEVSPIVDGDRCLLWLDATLKEVFSISLDTYPAELLQLIDAQLLLGFALNGPSALEGYFVFDLKREEFVFVVTDALLHGGKSLLHMELRARREVAKAFATFASSGEPKTSTFSICMQRTYTLAQFFPKVFWNESWEARVLVEGEDRWPVLGVRWRDLASPHVSGVSDSVVEWYYARQTPLFVLAVAPPPNEQLIRFFFGQGIYAGNLSINPAHVDAVSARLEVEPTRQCVLKMIFAPEKGHWNVRGVFGPDRKCTLPAVALQLFCHMQENITKEELLGTAPTTAHPAKPGH